jgi:hypothetical protein
MMFHGCDCNQMVVVSLAVKIEHPSLRALADLFVPAVLVPFHAHEVSERLIG